MFSDFSNLLAAIKEGRSVELLLNWNCIGFLRWGLQCLKGLDEADKAFSTINAQYSENVVFVSADKEMLNQIVNGDYWQTILMAKSPVDLKTCESEMVARYLDQFKKGLLKGNYPIVPRYGLIPKYHMIYVTGSHHGFELMNDTMAKARSKSLSDQFIKDFLFDMTPDAVRRDLDVLPEKILSFIKANPKQLFKPDIKIKLISQLGAFAKYEDKMFTAAVRALRKEKKISPYNGRKVLEVCYEAI